MSPTAYDHDPSLNKFGMLRATENQTPNQVLRAQHGGSHKIGRRYDLTRGGTINQDAVFRVEGITGSFGFLQVQSMATWETIILSKPGGICEPFEVEMTGPLMVEAAGLSNCIAVATVMEMF